MEDPVRRLYAVQFHPEVVHTPEGAKCSAVLSWIYLKREDFKEALKIYHLQNENLLSDLKPQYITPKQLA